MVMVNDPLRPKLRLDQDKKYLCVDLCFIILGCVTLGFQSIGVCHAWKVIGAKPRITERGGGLPIALCHFGQLRNTELWICIEIKGSVSASKQVTKDYKSSSRPLCNRRSKGSIK